MGIVAGSIIASLIAALLYGTASGVSTGASYSNDAPDGFGDDFWGADTAKANYDARLGYDGLTSTDRDYLRDYYTRDTLDHYTRSGNVLADWWQTVTHPQLWGKHADWDRAQRDYDEYMRVLSELGERPGDIDFQGLADKANATIDDENSQVLALYDQMLNRSNDLFSQEMANNNAMYNDYANQVLANNAMSTQAIAGSTRFEMDRARRNAIARGASAAQRLTANINAQLGLQNQAAQQQLATSNQLASALLQQRQAAAQLRGDYVSNLNADASRRAGLIQGTAERKSGLRNSYYNEAEARRSAEEEQWKNRLYGYLGDSPYATIEQRRQSRSNQPSSTYGL